MRTRISWRGAIGGLAAVGISTGFILLLAVVSSAATPTLSVTATDAVVGQPIQATAQLAEGPNATGEISFEVFGPGDASCSGPALTPAPTPAAVTGEGEYSSGGFIPTEAGTYRWSAHYSGDLENPPADSTCSAASVVAKATPGLTGDASDATVNAAIHDEVTLSGGFSPAGEVVFKVFAPGDTGCATPLATSSAPLVSGHAASPDFAPQQAGEFRWTADYTGDDDNEPVSLGCGSANQTSTVGKASPGLTGTATSGQVGSTITDSVTVSAGFNPGGELHFRAFAPGDSSCAGSAQYEATVAVSDNDTYAPAGFAPGAGSYRWTVDYSGDANNKPASLVCGAPNQTSTVGKAAPGLTGAATSAAVGGAITDYVTVAGGFSPGGNLSFRAFGPGDASCSGTVRYEATVAVNGNGAYGPAGFAPGAGSYRWKVEYEGDANNAPTSLACGASNQTSTVGKASPGLTGLAGSGAAGSTVTDSVTVSAGSNPGGELHFRAFGPGDPSCSGPVRYEASVTVNGNGAYAPPGFTPGTGSYGWEVEYSGNTDNEPADLPCGAPNQTSTVGKASPNLVGLAGSGPVGSTITDSVTVSAGFNPGGELHFRAFAPGDSSCAGSAQYEATVAVSGNGGYAPPGFAPGAGSYRWTVDYTGDANNEPASLGCGSANQDSVVSKAAPTLTGTATSAPAGSTITDDVTLAGGLSPGGNLRFRAFGPGDASCSGTVRYEATVPVSGNGAYAPPGFAPPPGLYRWSVEYTGDADNGGAGLLCGDPSQASAVGTIDVILSDSATSATVGDPVAATASIQEGAIPGGQLTFAAFPPSDASCSGAPAFTSTVSVVGNGTYRSPAFVPTRVGAFRWTVSYSGDANHAATKADCGKASSIVAPAKPSIESTAPQQLAVGTPFQITATLQGGFAPTGTVSFRIYGPNATGCAKPLSTNTVTVSANGTVGSAPFVALVPGRYTFVASYSGNAANQAAAESCDPAGRVAVVAKRSPTVKPRARLKGGKHISIRARLTGATSPSGTIRFRLYGPGDERCQRKPLFSGGVTVKANGRYLLAQYLATRPGTYRLSVSYSGDKRNRLYAGSCSGAQQIKIH